MARRKETPIERMFLNFLHRKMSTVERRILLRKLKTKLNANIKFSLPA
jgi:hypothetical protein